MARLRIDKLGAALAGNVSNNQDAARRRRGKETFRQQTEALKSMNSDTFSLTYRV